MSGTTRAEIEDLYYREAALLDAWRLDEWLAMLTDDACYYVPPNDKPDADHRSALFTIADNNARLQERVKRITDPNCHAEQPPSRTRRLIGNVRILSESGDAIETEANFILHRFRRGEDVRVFVGRYRYKLRREAGTLKIAERRAILDAEELGAMGAVSFILLSLYLYAVRCNFLGGPARELAWHEWYNGPKMRQMLALPHFLSMQRFAATALDTRRKYLALWLIRTPEAFETPQYKAQWGFADWTGEIGDWSRDLYRAPDSADALLDISESNALYLASADGKSESEARALAARAAAARPAALWIEAVGLDRHAPMLGLARLAPGEPVEPLAISGLNETVFAPLTPRMQTAAAA